GLCTIAGSSYVPGAFALRGSPVPDVLKTMNWARSGGAVHAGAGGAASAALGSRRNQAGSPVASDRSPTQPAPKRVVSRASRREIVIELLTDLPRRSTGPGRPRRT